MNLFRVLGYMLIIAGFVSFLLSFGSAFVIYAPLAFIGYRLLKRTESKQ